MFDYTTLLPTLQTMAMVICFGGAALLFLRGRNNRSRNLLAMIMFFWGLVYVARVFGQLLENHLLSFNRFYVMEPFVLIVGNLYLIFLLLYPVEIVRPGWLNLKRVGLILLPYLVVTLVYVVFLHLLGQEPVKLQSFAHFWRHFGEFNVGYRFFMALAVVFYLVILLRLTWRYEHFYRQWCRNNYSNDNNMDISWLRCYGVWVMLIGVGYFVVLFYSSPFSLMFHNLMVQAFFCFALYKGLFHNNPYSENFFQETLDEENACQKAEQGKFPDEQRDAFQADMQGGENIFLKKLPDYQNEVAAWMVRKKPYLNPDFKLMDVSDVLPLNRTYISRVFNEGFGGSFSDIVRDYRIQEAERLLADCKDIPVGQVGELCGFSSPSVFHRAFVQSHDGLTPKRYRMQAESNAGLQ